MPTPHEKEAEEAIAKLEAVVTDIKTRYRWTEEDVKVIDQMIQAFKGWLALGWFFSVIKNALIWIGIFSAGVVAIRAGLLEWLGLSGGPKP